MIQIPLLLLICQEFQKQSLLNFSAETFIDSTFLKDGTWVGGDWIPGNITCHFPTVI